MPEVVGAFSRPKLGNERADRSIETRHGALSDLTQERFEFAVGKLDRIEIRRVLRQVTQCRACLLDRFQDAGDLVSCEVVDHDDIVALERVNQALLDIGHEHLAGHGSFDHHGRSHFAVPQRGHEGDRLPFSEWDAADQSDAARRAPSKPHQIGTDGGLIDKHQPSGIKHALLPDPAPARAGDIRSLPFGGLQAFF